MALGLLSWTCVETCIYFSSLMDFKIKIGSKATLFIKVLIYILYYILLIIIYIKGKINGADRQESGYSGRINV